jgi:hypothetical protein
MLSSSGQSDVFIAKYDTIAAMNSTPIWAHKGGGAGYDISYGVCTDAPGNIFITGVFTGNANFDGANILSAGGDDIYIAKYNSAGTIQWARSDGGLQGDKGLAVVAAGTDVYYTGWFSGSATIGATNFTGAGLDEIFIAKINGNGSALWAQKAGGTGYDQGYGICTDALNNVYITGSYDSVALFGTTTLISAGSWDVFFAKYSVAGSFQWVMSGGSPASNTFERDIGYSIKSDTAQNLYATGVIRNTATFGTFSLPSFGIQDVFVTKISLMTDAKENISHGGIIMYPNPAKNQLAIGNKQLAIKNVQIYNMHGQCVFIRNPESGAQHKITIDISDFVSGIYFIRLYDGKNIRTAKFVKE